MRKLLFNLHLYTALIAGVFILILGVTGSIMAFEPELDHLFNAKLFKVEPRGQLLPVAAVIEAVSKAMPKERPFNIGIPGAPDLAYVVAIRPQGQVFVNGYTGEILGTRGGGRTFLGNVHQFHLRLLWGKTGQTIVGIVGVVTVFLLISGIYLWWPLKRVAINTSASWRRITFDLHNAVGIFSVVFLLLLSVTGVIIAYDDTIFSWLYKVTNTAPLGRTAQSTPQPGARPISLDQALEIARATIPGARPISVVVPAGAKASISIPMRFPEDLTPGGRSWVVLDQFSGKVLLMQSSRTAPGVTRMIIANRAIHTGDIFGIPSKLLASICSSIVILQAITGVYMWWKRPRSKQPPSP